MVLVLWQALTNTIDFLKKVFRDFPGGAVVGNLSTDAGDTG